jgi:hypothetical protein
MGRLQVQVANWGTVSQYTIAFGFVNPKLNKFKIKITT